MSRKAEYTRFSAKDVTEQVKNVLTDKWQTAALLACQVNVQPDAIARVRANKAARHGYLGTVEASKTDLVARSLNILVASGFAEKQKISNCKNEYRLARPNFAEVQA
jgi:hypothetical protein